MRAPRWRQAWIPATTRTKEGMVSTDCMIGLIDEDQSIRYRNLRIWTREDEGAIPAILDEWWPTRTDAERMLEAQPGDVQPEEAQAGEEPGEIRFAVWEAAAHSTDLISYVRSATELSWQPLTCVYGGGTWVAWQGQHRLAHEDIRAIIDGATRALGIVNEAREASLRLIRPAENERDVERSLVGPSWTSTPDAAMRRRNKRDRERFVLSKLTDARRETAAALGQAEEASTGTSRRANWLPGSQIWTEQGELIIEQIGELAQQASAMNEEMQRAVMAARESRRAENRKGAALRKEARGYAQMCRRSAATALRAAEEIAADCGLGAYFGYSLALAAAVATTRRVNDVISMAEIASESTKATRREAQRALQAAELALDATARHRAPHRT